MKYADKSVKIFLDNLAAKTPVPGGGSVAALTGALGCGLLSMVANFTMAKEGFNGYKERAKKALKSSEGLRRKLLDLVDKDIQAYEKLSKALKMNKTKHVNLEPVFKKAVLPPVEVCLYTHKAATISLELSYAGNKSIVSDVYAAMYALDAAFDSALVNVRLNLKYIKDKKFVTEKSDICNSLHKDIKRLKTEVTSKAKERMFS
ncbi:MAG: cyclodeaminase/cyclohydrolase family protein [Candidatus Omnitrophota bacterium]